MRIGIIGPGAMGLLYGAYLSVNNDVTLIGRNQKNMDEINHNGVMVEQLDGSVKHFQLNAVTDTSNSDIFDLIILFTKSGDSREALSNHKDAIGTETILMTLQNGLGHETVLKEFVSDDRILIGTTKAGSVRKTASTIFHSGKGNTAFGTMIGDSSRYQYIADTFTKCGLPCEVATDIKAMIWDKLMINASSSVLTGIFQVAQGQVATNEYIWKIAQKLITEICTTATADGYPYQASEQIDRIKQHLLSAPNGYTSIYEDLKAGRTTEVNVINGAVVGAAERLGVKVPTHEMIVDIVHAMEKKSIDMLCK